MNRSDLLVKENSSERIDEEFKFSAPVKIAMALLWTATLLNFRIKMSATGITAEFKH